MKQQFAVALLFCVLQLTALPARELQGTVHDLPRITPQQDCLAYTQHVTSFQPLIDQARSVPKGGSCCTDSRLCCHTQEADSCWQAQQPPLQPPLQAKQLQPQQLPPQQQVSFAPDSAAAAAAAAASSSDSWEGSSAAAAAAVASGSAAAAAAAAATGENPHLVCCLVLDTL